VREDLSAYFVLLILHAWAMALLVGGGLVVAVRLLGIASGASLELFGKLRRSQTGSSRSSSWR
jgi:ABC-type transporter Mla maintaining outer membrane lipid asymmetry permease subunit MlaE